MANQVDHAPRRQCRLGYFPGRVDRPLDGKKINVRETRARSAVLCASPRILSWRLFPTLAGRRPTGGEKLGDNASAVLPESACRAEQKTDHGEPIRPQATSAASP